MTYDLKIVINDREWYDSRIETSFPVIFQNINYDDGNDRSINVVRQRFMQDWARRIIPNSIRQGVDLGTTATTITVTQGYAIVDGRFIEIPVGSYDVENPLLTSPYNFYLMIQVHDGAGDPWNEFVEADDRVPAFEGARLIAIKEADFVKNHRDLVIAKFYWNGTVISAFEDYTGKQEVQADTISPTAAHPGLSTGSETILLRAGSVERVNNLSIETNKTRFYLNAVFTDQNDPIAGDDAKLINYSGVLQLTDVTETNYSPLEIYQLSTGSTISAPATATVRIDSSGNLTNIGTLNNQTFDGSSYNTGDIVTVDGSQELTNKTIVSPIVTNGGTFDSPILTTPFIQDESSNNTYNIVGKELTNNSILYLPQGSGSTDTFVLEDLAQDLEAKTLITPIIASIKPSASYTHTVPNVSNDEFTLNNAVQTLNNKTLEGGLKFWDINGYGGNYATIGIPDITNNWVYSIPVNTSDTFVMQGAAQNITGAKTFTANNLLVVGGEYWGSAGHNHSNSVRGGQININDSTTTLGIAKGGTGSVSYSNRNLIVSNDTATAFLGISPVASGRLLRSNGINSYPQWGTNTITVNLDGDVTGSGNDLMDANGDWKIDINNIVVVDNSHSHLLNQSGAGIYNYSPSSVNIYNSGIVVDEQNIGTYSLYMYDSGDWMKIPIPIIFYDKWVTNVRIALKANVASKGLNIQIRASYNDTDISKTTLYNTLATSTWDYYDITASWIINAERDAAFIYIESSSGTDAIVTIGSIQVTYS